MRIEKTQLEERKSYAMCFRKSGGVMSSSDFLDPINARFKYLPGDIEAALRGVIRCAAEVNMTYNFKYSSSDRNGTFLTFMLINDEQALTVGRAYTSGSIDKHNAAIILEASMKLKCRYNSSQFHLEKCLNI